MRQTSDLGGHWATRLRLAETSLAGPRVHELAFRGRLRAHRALEADGALRWLHLQSAFIPAHSMRHLARDTLADLESRHLPWSERDVERADPMAAVKLAIDDASRAWEITMAPVKFICS